MNVEMTETEYVAFLENKLTKAQKRLDEINSIIYQQDEDFEAYFIFTYKR
jgi:hypothetical protein